MKATDPLQRMWLEIQIHSPARARIRFILIFWLPDWTSLVQSHIVCWKYNLLWRCNSKEDKHPVRVQVQGDVTLWPRGSLQLEPSASHCHIPYCARSCPMDLESLLKFYMPNNRCSQFSSISRDWKLEAQFFMKLVVAAAKIEVPEKWSSQLWVQRFFIRN